MAFRGLLIAEIAEELHDLANERKDPALRRIAVRLDDFVPAVQEASTLLRRGHGKYFAEQEQRRRARKE